MKAFHSGREAKEFLISRIVAEAQREEVLLSEVERKMLYFTESGWTLPDMAAISEEFDNDCDRNKYEKKSPDLSVMRPSMIARSLPTNMTLGRPRFVSSREKIITF